MGGDSLLSPTSAGQASATQGPLDATAIRALALRTQDDRPFSLSQSLGRLVVLDFIYAGCGGTCPLQTAALAEVQARLSPALRERVLFVSVTIDPEHDLPDSLLSFARRNGADLSDWVFLTGDPGAVGAVAGLFRAGTQRPGADPAFAHSTEVSLLDRNGHGLMRYTGAPLDRERLLADIVTADRLGSGG